jgi:hypothetical protein
MKFLKTCATLTLAILSLSSSAAFAGDISGAFFPLSEGTEIDLSAEGTLDWVKFGNGEHDTPDYLVATKIGNPVFIPPLLTPLGAELVPVDQNLELFAFNGGGVLNFVWDNGNFGMHNDPGPVDTVVTQAITGDGVVEYPIGIGASFTAKAISATRVMNVYVQSFNADFRISASLSGGVSFTGEFQPDFFQPASDPGNDYAAGYFQIMYSGEGETLTVSIETMSPRTDGAQAAFANAGFFAATVQGPLIPEPSTFALAAAGLALIGMLRFRRRGATS